jgi:hypothetical protein
MVVRRKIDTPNTQIQSGGVKLVLWAQPFDQKVAATSILDIFSLVFSQHHGTNYALTGHGHKQEKMCHIYISLFVRDSLI